MMNGRRGKVLCVICVFKERDETRVLSGVVYMTKSRVPRTEPWETPQSQLCEEEKSLLHLTRKQREGR